MYTFTNFVLSTKRKINSLATTCSYLFLFSTFFLIVLSKEMFNFLRYDVNLFVDWWTRTAKAYTAFETIECDMSTDRSDTFTKSLAMQLAKSRTWSLVKTPCSFRESWTRQATLSNSKLSRRDDKFKLSQTCVTLTLASLRRLEAGSKVCVM